MSFNIKYTALCEVGLLRSNNEDAYACFEGYYVDPIGIRQKYFAVVVADGMGGEQSGEIASQIAVNTIQENFQILLNENPTPNIKQVCEQSIQRAHNNIISESLKEADHNGMGTTISIAIFIENDLYYSWVGDSRIYIYRPYSSEISKLTNSSKIDILTKDHSVAWKYLTISGSTIDDLESKPDSHIITQSLGALDQDPKPDFKIIKLIGNEKILLCTDGLNLHLKIQDLENVFTNFESNKVIADELMALIMKRGAKDNVTIVVVSTESSPGATIVMNEKPYNKPSFLFRSFLLNSKIFRALGLLTLLLAYVYFFHFKAQTLNPIDQINEETTQNELPILNKPKIINENRDTALKFDGYYEELNGNIASNKETKPETKAPLLIRMNKAFKNLEKLNDNFAKFILNSNDTVLIKRCFEVSEELGIVITELNKKVNRWDRTDEKQGERLVGEAITNFENYEKIIANIKDLNNE